MATEKEQTIRAKLFRADGKLLQNISYAARINRKPAAIRVTLASANKALKVKAKETNFSLENNDFNEQYRRAVEALANARGIASDSPLRREMEATGTEFLRHYRLRTRAVTIHEAVADDGQ